MSEQVGNSRAAVLLELSVPARRSLVQDLVRPVGSHPDWAPVLELDGAPGESEPAATGSGDAAIADFLAGIAHDDTGFVARTRSGVRAVAIVAATAAALCGDDIRAALAKPDVGFLTALRPPAVEAVRTVLLGIETDVPEEIIEALAILAPATDR